MISEIQLQEALLMSGDNWYTLTLRYKLRSLISLSNSLFSLGIALLASDPILSKSTLYLKTENALCNHEVFILIIMTMKVVDIYLL